MYNKLPKKYMRAVGGLYGKQIDLVAIVPPKKRKIERNCPREDYEQIVAHLWMEKKEIVHHHSPNGGKRDIEEAAKFKRMGVSAGFPDFEIPYMRKGFGGLYIELKTLFGGKLSERQIWWRDHLIKEGYAWYVAKGAQECIRIVSEYLDLPSG